MRKLTEAQRNVLRSIKKTGKRPSIRKAMEWDTFLELADMGLVEDGGGGFAEITDAGRNALTGGTDDR